MFIPSVIPPHRLDPPRLAPSPDPPSISVPARLHALLPRAERRPAVGGGGRPAAGAAAGALLADRSQGGGAVHLRRGVRVGAAGQPPGAPAAGHRDCGERRA